MRSRIARSMRSRPTRYWFSISSPTERTRRLPRWSMSSISPRPSRRSTSALTQAMMSSLRSVRTVSCGVEVEAHVHLHPADGREVVALGIEEQRAEHDVGGLDRRRLARAHDAVDVHERLVAVHVLVDRHRVADVGADGDVVDVERRDLGDAVVEQHLQRAAGDVAGLGVDVPGQLVAGLDPDQAGLLVDDVARRRSGRRWRRTAPAPRRCRPCPATP